MPASYEIPCEYLESQIEKDVARYLGAVSLLLGQSVRLLDADEAATGADALVLWKAVPVFMQFKRPFGLVDEKTVPLPPVPRANESLRQGIRRFRSDHRLASAPHSLAFQLRRRAKTATDLQHNVLFRHNGPPGSWAAYVCSLELSAQGYGALAAAGLAPCTGPFCWRDLIVRQAIPQQRLALLSELFRQVPFLQGHITIPPHREVQTHDHYYSFSLSGTDVAFHSPSILEDEPSRLSVFLAEALGAAAESFEELPTIARLARGLSDQRGLDGEADLPPANEGTEVSWLKRYGQFLRRTYGIRMFVFAVSDVPEEESIR